eukprot:scaffold14485_cov99-Isochrysis_galbana.AAC.1
MTKQSVAEQSSLEAAGARGGAPASPVGRRGRRRAVCGRAAVTEISRRLEKQTKLLGRRGDGTGRRRPNTRSRRQWPNIGSPCRWLNIGSP